MSVNEYVFPTYTQPEVEFERGEGMYLYDSAGNEYLDFTSGIAVNTLGHAHPELVAVLRDQADKLWHTSNLYSVELRKRVAKLLCDHSFADKVFFANSGAEALECAIKTARRYHYDKGQPERVNILTFEGAFHGRTLATIAAGGQEKYLEGFGPKTPGFISLPFGDLEAISAAVDENTAAILIEPIQGEGGIREVATSVLRQMRELCDRCGILLIYDEVQTGIGRTGKLFAHQWAGERGEASPDIMTLAKGLGGGMPIGACLARDEVASVMVAGTHATTFGGNLLAMAVAEKVLSVVTEDGFLENVVEQGKALKQLLAEIVDSYPDLLEEVRGTGLLVGIKARIANTDILSAFFKEGLLVVAAGDNVVRFAPSLIVDRDNMRAARDKMVVALDRLSNKKVA